MAIFVVVLGGIYGGIFTPAEGASVGVAMTLLAGLLKGALSLRALLDSLIETAASTAMIFAIVFGADLFNVALALSRMPMEVAAWFGEAGIAPMTVLLCIVAFYLVMGCVMDSLSLILLTVPVFFPTVMALDFGLTPEQLPAVWHCEIGLHVTPRHGSGGGGGMAVPTQQPALQVSSRVEELPSSHEPLLRGLEHLA